MSEPTCAEVLARTLRRAGVEVMFGLPGGEILDFIEAARQAGIRFVLTRHEATAAFMADVTGQILRRPGVCVSTLGPGRGQHDARRRQRLPRSIAARRDHRLPVEQRRAVRDAPASRPERRLPSIHETHRAAGWSRHRGEGAARAGRVDGASHGSGAHRAAERRRTLALARIRSRWRTSDLRRPTPPAPPDDIERVAAALSAARRPVLIVGLDVNPKTETAAVRAFVERMGLPTFVTPKAKGIISEDHRARSPGVVRRRCRRSGHRRIPRERGSARRCRIRAGRIGQALAPDLPARVRRSGQHRRAGEFRPTRGSGGRPDNNVGGARRTGTGSTRVERRRGSAPARAAARRAPAGGAAARAFRLRADARAPHALSARHHPGDGRGIDQVDHDAGLGRVRTADVLRVQRLVVDGLLVSRGDGRTTAVSRSADPLHDRGRRVRNDARASSRPACASACISSTVVYNDSALEPDRRGPAESRLSDATA